MSLSRLNYWLPRDQTDSEGFCRKVRFLGQNPKIRCQEFNGLEPPKPSKKQLCDRTKHATRGIDFEAVGDPGSGRGHLAEHPVVAQRPIRGDVKRADAAVGTDLTPRFFLEAPLVQPTDRHVQDGLSGRERQPIGVLARVGREMDLPLGIDTKDTGKADFPLRRRQT